MTILETVELEPSVPATGTIIWLHGLGADGHDFEAIVPELKLPEDSGIRFIFPHAPVRPVSINDGAEMRAWYDFVPHSETGGSEDIDESADQIRELIAREIERGIKPAHIVLAGFSQGGVIALHTGTRYDNRLAGILAISTYLHDFSGTEADMHDANLAIPILMAHGTQDEMIPIMRAATSRENLIRLGYDVRWFNYPMGHQVCLEEVEEIAAFFKEVLPR
ncbi:MAG: phospholipase/carboxylesterase [Candidatus Azotimanducaceae bacterium]|jgi:phospholipase/carboxylesterase